MQEIEEEIFAIISKENNGRERRGWVPTLSKSRKEQNGGPRAPLEFWLYITHLMKQKRLQLSSACVRVGRHSSPPPPPPTLSLSTLLFVYMQPFAAYCVHPFCSFRAHLFYPPVCYHSYNSHLFLLPHFLFTKIFKIINGFPFPSLICIFVGNIFFLFL